MVNMMRLNLIEILENSHFPALPNLKIEDGWAPVKEYFKIIIKENPNVKVMFEHRSDLISDEELEKCYSWIGQIWRGQI